MGNDTVVTDKVLFSADEIERYSRQTVLPIIDIAGQAKLKKARVLCIGAGGLSSPLLFYLVASGVGTIGIVDNDKVELSNLQRQILYSSNQIGMQKVDAAKKKLLELNPNANIITHNTSLTEENALSLIEQYDIVADGSDNFSTRYIANDACFQLNKPYVYAGIYQFEGQCAVFTTPGPCYRCLYESPPPRGLIPSCSESGVLGILPGLVGAIQGIEVTKLILNIGQSLTGRFLFIDALTLQFHEMEITPRSHCPVCILKKDFHELPHYKDAVCSSYSNKVEEITATQFAVMQREKQDFILLDVREPDEYAICNLKGKLIPLSSLKDRLKELNNKQLIVVHCKLGGRSEQAAKLLLQAGFTDVKHLKGGIMAWRNEIDITLPLY